MKVLRMLAISIFICLCLSITNNVHATATILDFEGLEYTDITAGDNTPDPASVLTNQFMSDGVMFGLENISAGVSVVRAGGGFAPSSGLNSVAGLDASGVIPGTTDGAAVGDIYFSFVMPNTMIPAITDFLSFTIGDSVCNSCTEDEYDIFDIRAYSLTNTLVYDQHFESISRFTFELPDTVTAINRVEVDFTGEFGYSLDDLNFNTPVAPEPISSILFIVGGATVGFRKFWTKRRSV